MMDQETEKILDLIQTFIINQIHNTLCYCNSSQHAEIQNLVQNRLQHSGIKQQGVVAHTYGSFRSVWCNCWVGKDFIIMCLSDFVSFLYIIFVLLGWRTSNIYCKTGMLVRNSLHYCFSKKLFSLMSKDKCIRYRILVCWLVCRLIPFIGFGNFSCISLSPNSFFFQSIGIQYCIQQIPSVLFCFLFILNFNIFIWSLSNGVSSNSVALSLWCPNCC